MRGHPGSSLARMGVVALLLGGLVGCGTVTFDQTFTVVVEDATQAQPVSIFDPQMGSTRDWARRTEGTASSTQLYTTTVPAVDTKMIFDSSPPQRVVVGVWLPEIDDAGYFLLTLEPQEGIVQSTSAGFVLWDENARRTEPPLPLSVASTATDHGWDVHLTVREPDGTASP